MPSHPRADENDCGIATSTHPAVIRVVLAYADLAAGLRAMRAIQDFTSGPEEDVEVQPLPWSLDLLEEPDWRELATRDVFQADLMVVATRREFPISPVIERWFCDIAAPRHGGRGGVVVRFDADETLDELATRLHGFGVPAARTRPLAQCAWQFEGKAAPDLPYLERHPELAGLLLNAPACYRAAGGRSSS